MRFVVTSAERKEHFSFLTASCCHPFLSSSRSCCLPLTPDMRCHQEWTMTLSVKERGENEETRYWKRNEGCCGREESLFHVEREEKKVHHLFMHDRQSERDTMREIWEFTTRMHVKRGRKRRKVHQKGTEKKGKSKRERDHDEDELNPLFLLLFLQKRICYYTSSHIHILSPPHIQICIPSTLVMARDDDNFSWLFSLSQKWQRFQTRRAKRVMNRKTTRPHLNAPSLRSDCESNHFQKGRWEDIWTFPCEREETHS